MKCSQKWSVLVLFGITTLLSGCASLSGAESEANRAKLSPGMSEAAVLSLLGTPDSTYSSNGIDKWVYEFRSENHRGTNTMVEFKSGSLVKVGEMSGREVAATQETRNSGSCTKWSHPEFRFESLCVH